MEKAQQILFHLDELYTDKASEDAIVRKTAQNPERYAMWVSAFERYDLSDVLQAIDQYWEYKNSKSRPSVAQIKAILNAHSTAVLPEENTSETNTPCKVDYAVTKMQEDIANGNCHHNLYVYKDAVDVVLNEWLKDVIPVSVWVKMKYDQRFIQAEDKGLFANFDEALHTACQRRYGKNDEFQSANDLANAEVSYNAKDLSNSLLDSWRM